MLKCFFSFAEFSLQKKQPWNTVVDETLFVLMRILCHSGNKKTYLFSNQNENNQCIIETWKKLKYKKSTNGNQELQNIQKEFSQGQAKIILFFSKEEHYELEL